MGKRKGEPQMKPGKRTTAGGVVPSVASMSCSSTSLRSSNKAAGDGKVHVAVLHFCTRGCLYGDMFDDGPLHVVQMMCSMSPNPLYQMKAAILAYCAGMRDKENKLPENWDEFQDDYAATLAFVSKKTQDQDMVGYVRNRTGFYVSGGTRGVKNLLMLLDEVWKFRVNFSNDELEKLPVLLEVLISVPADFGMTIEKDEDQTHCDMMVEEKVDENMHVLHLPPPCFPARYVIMTVEPISDNEAHFVFSGNTQMFADGFTTLKWKLGSVPSPGISYKAYFRIKANMDVADTSKAVQTLKDVFGNQCLCHSPVLVRCKPASAPTEKLKAVLAEVKDCENVFLED